MLEIIQDFYKAISIIGFIGSVFSPWYYWSKRKDPQNHVCINVAMYGKGWRWTMTERGKQKLKRTQNTLKWDQDGRRFRNLSELYSYCARVASSVGVMMCILMDVRDEDALARACDLGIAMQLTNIARDIGEDARNKRIYIPTEWMDKSSISIEKFLENPENFPEVSTFVKQLLNRADYFYKRAGAGYFSLPKECRPGIFSAGKIYSKIGKHIAASNYDSINNRAYTTTFEKFLMLISSIGNSALTTVMPVPSTIHAPAIPEVNFLVSSVKKPKESKKSFKDRSSKFINLLFDLEQKDRALAGI